VLLLGNDSAYMKRESSKRSCVSQAKMWAHDFQDGQPLLQPSNLRSNHYKCTGDSKALKFTVNT